MSEIRANTVEVLTGSYMITQLLQHSVESSDADISRIEANILLCAIDGLGKASVASIGDSIYDKNARKIKKVSIAQNATAG